jgi:acylphosphatase
MSKPEAGSQDDDDTRIIHVTVRGRVQGVGYRAWVQGQAAAHSLRGWVRNRADGSVEAVFAGDPDSVAIVAEALLRGPPTSQVSGVDIRAETESALNAAFGAGFVALPTA